MHGERLGAIADGGQQDRLEAYEQDQRETRRDLGARHAAHGRGRGPSPGGSGRRRREEPQAARYPGETEQVVEQDHVSGRGGRPPVLPSGGKSSSALVGDERRTTAARRRARAEV